MSDIEGLTSFVPEAFYDAIAYITPAVILCAGLFYLTRAFLRPFMVWLYCNPPGAVYSILLVLLTLPLLYLAGQLLSTFSFWIIERPLALFAKKIHLEHFFYPPSASGTDPDPDGLSSSPSTSDPNGSSAASVPSEPYDALYADYTYLTLHSPPSALEATKRLARMMLARSSALAFALLAAVAALVRDTTALLVLGILCVLLVLEYYKRRTWYYRYLSTMTAELRKSEENAGDQ
jgi:hypothetical protein